MVMVDKFGRGKLERELLRHGTEWRTGGAVCRGFWQLCGPKALHLRLVYLGSSWRTVTLSVSVGSGQHVLTSKRLACRYQRLPVQGYQQTPRSIAIILQESVIPLDSHVQLRCNSNLPS